MKLKKNDGQVEGNKEAEFGEEFFLLAQSPFSRQFASQSTTNAYDSSTILLIIDSFIRVLIRVNVFI